MELKIFFVFSFITGIFGQIPVNLTVKFIFVYENDPSRQVHLFESAKKHLNPNKNVMITTMHSDPKENPSQLVARLCKEFDDAMNNKETRPDFVLDFTTSEITSEAIKVITRSLNIPTISTSYGQSGDIVEWKTLTQKQKNYLVQVSPPNDIFVQSIRSIIQVQKMTSAAILYDPDDFVMNHKHKSLLRDLPVRHLITKLDKEIGKLSKLIQRLDQIHMENIFILANAQIIDTTLSFIIKTFCRPSETTFYALTPSNEVLTCEECRQVPLNIIHLKPMATPKTDLIEGDYNVHELFYFDITVKAVNAIGQLKAQGKWTELNATNCVNFDMTNMPKELDLDLYTPLYNQRFLFDYNLTDNGFNYLNLNYSISRVEFNQSTVNTEDWGIWYSGLGHPSLIELFEGKNLTEHSSPNVYRIVTYIEVPFVAYKDNCNESTLVNKYDHCLEGISIDLIDEIAKKLSFKYSIKVVNSSGDMVGSVPNENIEETMGYSKVTSYNWTGVMEKILNREADIGIGALAVTPEREKIIDFTIPFYEPVGYSILLKKRSPPTNLWKFLSVLEGDVWFSILGAYFFTSLLLWIFDRYSPYSYQNNKEKYEDECDDEKREFSLREALWFCMTSLTPQGGGEAPKNLSGRLVAATWWLFGFIIMASYTANLAAFLTVSRLDTPIESMDDLSKQFKVTYAPYKDSPTHNFYKKMAYVEHRFYEIWKDMSLNDSLEDYERAQLAVWDYPISDKFTKLMQSMEENDPPKTLENAIDRVKLSDSAEPFALVSEYTELRYAVLLDCSLRLVGEQWSQKPLAIAVQKGSPLRPQLSEIIDQFDKDRFIETLKDKWWDENPRRDICPTNEQEGDGIPVKDIGGVFIVITCGIIIAIIASICEVIWVKRRPQKVNQTMKLEKSKDQGENLTPTDFK